MTMKKTKRTLSVPEQHQLRVALKTLNTPKEIATYLAAVSNAPTHEQAKEIIERLTGRKVK